ncbi:MMPL family transporter [Pseudohaliea sp.]|uniref:efflux RND transporter permease subunit n=1 Tax=Pseudohaliea sp. TaxID=2740289 RepID=UPI0032EE7BDF
MKSASSILDLRSILALRYRRCIEQPILILAVVFVLCLLAGTQIKYFRFDASSDSLIARGDPDLLFFEEVSERFSQAPALIVTVRPLARDLFSSAGVKLVDGLVRELEALAAVASVQSLLDAPLLRSPPVPLSELAEGFRTLRSTDVDFALARDELLNSPVFSELLVNVEGSLAAIVVNLNESETLRDARVRMEAVASDPAGDGDARALARAALTEARETAQQELAATIAGIRSIRESHEGEAEIYLGGVPLVASDMVRFVRSDMLGFGAAVLALIAVALFFFFRELRWVFIPLGTSLVTVWLTMGVIAALGQPVTAVSANFVALLTITTVSFTVHLIASFRELAGRASDMLACDLAFETMKDKLAPCVFTALTTVVAFGSLVVSDIVPIRTFGWMMCVGIVVSLVVTYSFFASILVLLPGKKLPGKHHGTPRLSEIFARLSTTRSRTIVVLGIVLAVAAVHGASELTLGNKLAKYFRGDTEIRQGLEVIDRELGGTVPLDIILQFDAFTSTASHDEDAFADPFDDPFSDGSGPDPYPERFWFTPEKLRIVERLQAFLDSQDAIGKTLSVSSFERVARGFNDNQPLSYVALSGVLGAIPEDVRRSLIDPLASPAAGQLRISARLRETATDYELSALISRIERHAVEELGIERANFHITGIGILFNNMLKLFFESQFSTLGFVLLATLTMFTLLLRSWKLAVIGLLPNLLAAGLVLAFMGFLAIPLDVMTITIAAIVIGIGVDDAIHFLHRYRSQLQRGSSVRQAVLMSHRTTGQALYFTSATVMAGFSVLLLSRFVPTAYFGCLAALAMLLALVANLMLLPALLMLFHRPTGRTL